MRILLLSDLHFECQVDGGRSFIEMLDPAGVDLLVLAGDIATRSTLKSALSALALRFPRVVYTCGNHEYWGAAQSEVFASIRAVEQAHPNFTWLNDDLVEVQGHRILGTTLWFPESPLAVMQAAYWADFKRIPNFAAWGYEANKRATKFLEAELRKGDIVVSHHLPSYLCVHQDYKAAPTNCFYVCELEALIAERTPLLWMHGHSHRSADYKLHETRIVCNPLGYILFGEVNTGFNGKLMLDV